MAERRGSRVSFFSPAKVSCDSRGRLTMLAPGNSRSTIGRTDAFEVGSIGRNLGKLFKLLELRNSIEVRSAHKGRIIVSS